MTFVKDLLGRGEEGGGEEEEGEREEKEETHTVNCPRSRSLGNTVHGP